jgi:GT2 family glycosyltransferase
MCSIFKSDSYTKAIESVFNQSIYIDDFVVVNDSGRNAPKEINYTNVTLLNNEYNLGLAKSLNIAIAYILNKYNKSSIESISIIDDDDVWIDNKKLEKQISFLKQYADVGLVSTRAKIINKYGSIIDNGLHSYSGCVSIDLLMKNNPIVHPSVMFNPAIFYDYLYLYDSNMRRTQDLELWLRILKDGYFKIFVMQDICVSYRSPNSTIYGRIKKIILDIRYNKVLITKHDEFKNVLPTSIVGYVCDMITRKLFYKFTGN